MFACFFIFSSLTLHVWSLTSAHAGFSWSDGSCSLWWSSLLTVLSCSLEEHLRTSFSSFHTSWNHPYTSDITLKVWNYSNLHVSLFFSHLSSKFSSDQLFRPSRLIPKLTGDVSLQSSCLNCETVDFYPKPTGFPEQKQVDLVLKLDQMNRIETRSVSPSSTRPAALPHFLTLNPLCFPTRLQSIHVIIVQLVVKKHVR